MGAGNFDRPADLAAQGDLMPPTLGRRAFLKSSAASLTALSSLAHAAAAAAPSWQAAPSKEWPAYGGDQGASRYSPIEQLTPANIRNLKVAWVHHTEDASERPATTIETTPIVVGGVMYIQTAKLQVRALNAANGEVLWNFNPFEGNTQRRAAGVSRGVCYWQDEEGKDKRIFAPVRDMLYCLDAGSGKLVESFANKGVLDLNQDFDKDMEGLSYRLSSPPVAYRDLILCGGGGGEGPYPQAPGHIRGYDARSGERRWIFHTIPRPGEFGHDTWEGDSWQRAGGTNNWAGMSLDVERGWLFASIGSPSFDYYGGDRKGANLFGNCVVALDAATGKRQWHFQAVHHDVWDYDLPAQPALFRAKINGRNVDAVAQVTKMGLVFLLDRKTGKPLFGIEERPIEKSDVPGEELWPTQPFPLKPPPLNRIAFTEDEITNISPEAHAHVRAIWERSRAGKIYTPPSLQGTIVHPGFRGGALWGGCCFDPERNLLIVPSGEWTNRITLAEARPDQPFRYALPERIKFEDAEGYPGIKPPWGYLTAIDLNKGDFSWRTVTGEFEELTRRGIPRTGTPSHGGAIATAGGLVFMAGTFDKKFRAFNSDSGEVVWEHTLNAGGFATPSTYEADGKQHVVIAAGGGKGDTNSGDEFVVFALS
jgi:quinoprotein glucose dehydrogenase